MIPWMEGLSCRRVSTEGRCGSILSFLCWVLPSGQGCTGSTHPTVTQSHYVQAGSETHSAKEPEGEVVSVPGHCPESSAPGIVSASSRVRGAWQGARAFPVLTCLLGTLQPRKTGGTCCPHSLGSCCSCFHLWKSTPTYTSALPSQSGKPS